jgi:hypothetical protein
MQGGNMTALALPASGFGCTPVVPQGCGQAAAAAPKGCGGHGHHGHHGGHGANGVNAIDAAAQFAGTLRMCMAKWRHETLGALLSACDGKDKQHRTGIDSLIDAGATPGSGPTDPSSVLSADGRNMSLFDPEAAYAMMTLINGKDVDYKAEFAEMSDMKSWLATLQGSTGDFAGVSESSSGDDIAKQLQSFVDAYNGWIERFAPDLAPGGILAATQAAQVSQWELEQSVENIFNGAAAGIHGMRDLGITIDPVSNIASLDRSRLDATLAENKAGAVAALKEFGTGFARAAELLASEGNFVPNRLDNLGRAISYIDDNRLSLQAEFGMGNAAQPNAQVAKALDAYESMRGMAA